MPIFSRYFYPPARARMHKAMLAKIRQFEELQGFPGDHRRRRTDASFDLKADAIGHSRGYVQRLIENTDLFDSDVLA